MVRGRKFGRVVKAVALGAILVRGRGSNPLACNFFLLVVVLSFWSILFLSTHTATLCPRVPVVCLSVSIWGRLISNLNRYRARGLVVMIVACQVIDPGSIPGERTLFGLCTCRFAFFCKVRKKKQKVWRTRVSIPVPHAC